MEREEVVGYVICVPSAPFKVIEPRQVFVIFILVRIVVYFEFDRPPDPPAQNRYLPLLFAIWLTVGVCSRQCSRPTHSSHFITANESRAYTYEARALVSL